MNTGKFLTLRFEDLIASLMTFLHFMGALGQLYWHLALIWILFFVLWIRFGWVVFFQSQDSKRSFAAIFIVASVIATPSAMIVTGLVSSPDTIIGPYWYAFESRYMFPVLFFPLFVGWPLLLALSGWTKKDQALTSPLAAGFSGDYRYGLGCDQNLAFRLPAVRAFPNHLMRFVCAISPIAWNGREVLAFGDF